MIAVVLKKTNFDEYDQLVHCYSLELGKSVFVAKSISRPTSKQSLHLDILNLVEFSPVEGKNKLIITGADSVETFGGIKKSIKKLSVAFIVLEIMEKVVPFEQSDEALWDFTLKFLYALDKSKESQLSELVLQTKKGLSNILGYGEQSIESLFSDVWGERMWSIKFAKQLSPEL